jgi:O-antigen ligase
MSRRQNEWISDSNWTSTLSLALLTLFLFLAFMQHGLLFKPEYLIIGSLLYIGASLLIIRGFIPKQLFFYLLISFVGWTFLTTSYAINQQEALNTAFRFSLAIPFVILASQLTNKHRLLLIRILIYLSSGWIVVGLLFKQYRDGRFEGTLGYANSWGILLLAALILNFTVSMIDNKKADKWISLLLIGGVLLTGSRTVFVLMLILIPLQLLLVGKNRWLSMMPQKKILWITVYLAASLSILFTAVLISHQTGSLERLTNINLQASEWTSRLGYYRDAWSIIMDSPLLGYGGGAWHILQYQYQTADYTVRYLHNFWLETWIDSGLLGLLLLSSMVATFIWISLLKYRTATGHTKTWIVGCFLAGICLLCHSTIDFSFSYSMLFALWTIFPLFSERSLEPTNPKLKNVSNSWTVRIALSLSLLIAAYFSIRLGIAESLIIKSDQISLNQKNTKEAIGLLQQSEKYAFFPAEQHEKIARLLINDYLNHTQQISNALSIAEVEISKAYERNPEDPQAQLLQCQIDYAKGNRTEALKQLSVIKNKYPFHHGIHDQFDKWMNTGR